MGDMFCFQCEQTVQGKGCTKSGACGKNAVVSGLQDELTGALVGLARVSEGKNVNVKADELVLKSLFATITNVNFDPEKISRLISEVRKLKIEIGVADDMPLGAFWEGDEDTVSLRSIYS
jgi:hydroxylamine reductase